MPGPALASRRSEVPWCEDCARFYTPTSMGEGGECPTCSRVIGAVPKVPWHFKLLLGATVIYLGWRLVQGLGWLAGRF
jgi:hypothetical protein